MKAIRLHARGGPGQLTYEDAPKPSLKAGDALVRVYACAITPTELSWSATYTTHDGADRLRASRAMNCLGSWRPSPPMLPM